MSQVYNTLPNARIVELIPAGASSALDIGCGTGKLGTQMKELGIATDGVTFSASEREIAKRNLRNVWLFNLEEGLPHLDKTYDLLVLSHIMEHISNPTRLLTALGSILSKNGHILCAIPNMLFLYNRLKLLTGRVEYEEFGLMDYTHVRWYTRKTLIELFLAHGYQMDAALVHGYAPLGPFRKIITSNMAAYLDTALVKLAPDLLACEFAFRFKRSL